MESHLQSFQKVNVFEGRTETKLELDMRVEERVGSQGELQSRGDRGRGFG